MVIIGISYIFRNLMIDLNEPTSVVANDAGGANQIVSFLRNNINKKTSIQPYMNGPAKKIWQLNFPEIHLANSIENAVVGTKTLISGTGWQTDIEKKARADAKKNKIKSIAFLDHWVNYKERFIYKNTLQMPDELWVVDRYAFEIATNKFSNIPIKIVDDFYLKDQLKLINEPALEYNQLLYILEPIRDNWGKSIQGEFQALDYFFRNIHKLELPENTIIVLRLHPSESRSKYEIYIKKNHDYEVKIESDNTTLANSISSSKWVVGCQSYAMSIAIAANRNVICSLPPAAPYCKLPHINIKHLKEI